MLHIRFAYAFISIPLFLSVLPVRAQESGTGSVQSEEEIRWEQRDERATDFRNAAFRIRKKVQAFNTQRVARQEKREENRENCREEIRRSNRDAKMETLLRCYRTELTVNLETLRKRKQLIEESVGISDEQKTATLAALDELIDAVSAIIAGIDSGVYQTHEELVEAKQNLHARYRATFWLSLTHARSDKMLTWIAHMLVRLDALVAKGNLPAPALENFSGASDCLQLAESEYTLVLEAETYEDAKEKIRQAQSTLKSCIPSLRSGIQEKKNADGVSEPETTETGEKSQKRGLAFV